MYVHNLCKADFCHNLPIDIAMPVMPGRYPPKQQPHVLFEDNSFDIHEVLCIFLLANLRPNPQMVSLFWSL